MSKVKITKKTVKNIVAVLLAILISFGAIFGLVKLFSNNETAMKKVSPTVFSVGGLNVKGEYIDTDDTLYSELIECRGLTIEQDFESQSKYQVFYYNEDKVFIGRSDELKNTTYEIEDKYDIAKFCRIVINPMQLGDNSETFKIKFWEVLSYADDLTIKVYEKQNFVSLDIIHNANVYPSNSTLENFIMLNYMDSNNPVIYSCREFSESVTSIYNSATNVLGFKVDEIKSIKVDNSLDTVYGDILFLDANKTLVSKYTCETVDSLIVSVPDNAVYCLINYDTSKSLTVKKYTLR